MFQHFFKVTYFFCVSNLPLTVVLDTAKADFFTLYDGTGLPATQPWFFSAGNNSYTQTGQADGVRLETNLDTSVLLVGTMVVPVLCCFFSIYIRKKFARAVSTGFSVRQGNLKCPVTFGLAASHHRSIELKFDVAVCIDGDQAT